MAKQMLVIIDPQNDFTHLEGSYARKHAGITQITESKARINQLLHSFNPNEILFVRSDYKPDQFEQGLSICIPGTFGHQIDADFVVDNTWSLFTKTEHSCFSSEEFRKQLAVGKTDTLFLCGYLAEYCVRQTAADALEAGCKVYLVDDCIATGDDVQHRKQQALAELKRKGAIIIESKDLV